MTTRLLCASVFALALFALPVRADECRGLKSAHCRCQVKVGRHQTTGNPELNLITPGGWEGKDLFTYTIPKKCFNQQKDWVDYKLGNGCWKACRDAYGVEGATPDPALLKLKAEAGKKMKAGGYCGGWVSGETYFAAGTNKYRSNTASGIGIGIGGTVRMENGKKVCK